MNGLANGIPLLSAACAVELMGSLFAVYSAVSLILYFPVALE